MIEIRDVSLCLSAGTIQEHVVFSGLRLKIAVGEWVNVIGGNGAGKSTLLNLIAGKIRPTKGEIFISGENVTAKTLRERCTLVGRVFQDPLKGSWPGLTIEENLALAACRGYSFGFNRALNKGLRKRFKTLLKHLDLDLESRLKVPMGSLSGGQRQAVSLLMASLNNPKVLLLDEHTAALDPKMSKVILSLTQELFSLSSPTVLMVTHNMHHALTFGQRTILLKQKSIFKDWSGEERRRLTPNDLIEAIEND